MRVGGFAFQAPTTGVHDRDGRFSLRVAASTLSLIITGQSFAKKQLDGVVLAAGKTTDLGVIAVERGRVVEGRVVDQRKTPVAGARVMAGSTAGSRIADAPDDGRALRSGLHSAVTGPDGRFTLYGVAALRPGGPIEIAAAHAAHGRVDRTLADGQREIELVLAATGALAGTVRFAAGRAAVEVERVGGGGRALAHPSPSGAYRVDGLAPGRYEVTAMIIPSRMGPSRIVEVRANETATADLEFPRDTITLGVTVHEDCEIVMLKQPGERAPLVLERCAPGARSIELPGVLPGSYEVCADRTCAPVVVAPSPSRQSVDPASAKRAP